MDIDHVHFYVEDARVWRDWFRHTLGFQSLTAGSSPHTHTEIIGAGGICIVLSSACSDRSPVAHYLQQHPSGIVDLAFRVTDLSSLLNRAIEQGVKLLQPLQTQFQPHGCLKWAQVAGWGDLKHTMIERTGLTSLLPILTGSLETSAPDLISDGFCLNKFDRVQFTGIDHAVLNVAVGDLERAVSWYENTLGFKRQQSFAIQTQHSGLCSQVLRHPNGTAQLPINEPASTGSQIQEFLDANRGAGVQHLALQVTDIVQTITHLRQQGLTFLQVPPTYYTQLRQRPGFQLPESVWQAIARQEVLVDWQQDLPEAMLMQAFTQPIFREPTFFFELIERQSYWANQQYQQAQGFGEGNFRALFEAIEREQIKRGTLS